jgi:hypothetical protein
MIEKRGKYFSLNTKELLNSLGEKE